MSEKLQNPPKLLPPGFTVDARRIRFFIAQNLQHFESETEGVDYISLWEVPVLLGIDDDDLVVLLIGRYVPAPELFSDGLYFGRSTLLSALRKLTGTASPVSSIRGEGEQ